MTLQQIEAFISVVENGTFAKAAEKLYITQPTLTHRINELEKELGINLILRNRGIRKVELTENGKAFFPKALKWKSLWTETLRDVRDVKKEDILVSLGPGFMDHFGKELCLQFAKRGFDINISYTISSAEEIYRRIENGTLDWGITIGTYQSLYADALQVAEEEMVLLSQTPINGKKNGEHVSLMDLDRTKEIEYTWENEYVNWRNYWRKENCIAPIYTDSMELLKYFLKEQGGWSIVPISFATQLMKEDDFFILYKIKENIPIIKMYLVSAREPKQPYFECFREDMVSVLSSLEGVRICV